MSTDPTPRRLWRSAPAVLPAADNLLVALETAHDRILPKLRAGKIDKAGVSDALTTARRRVEDIKRAGSDIRVDTAIHAFADYERCASRIADDKNGTDGKDLEAALDQARRAIRALKERASRVNQHRALARFVGTLTLSWFGAFLVANGVATSIWRNAGVQVAGLMPGAVREWIDNPETRERQSLGDPSSCERADWDPFTSNGLQTVGVQCRSWTFPVWRDFPDGIVLVPDVSPERMIRSTTVRRVGSDVVVLKSAPFVDRPSQLRGRCVYQVGVGDRLRFVVFAEEGASIVDATAIHLSTANDEAKFCLDVPR